MKEDETLMVNVCRADDDRYPGLFGLISHDLHKRLLQVTGLEFRLEGEESNQVLVVDQGSEVGQAEEPTKPTG